MQQPSDSHQHSNSPIENNTSMRPQPRSNADLFWSFSILAMQGFGGVVAIVQRELVERKQWMTREEFVEEWAVAQVMPGPNVVNLAMIIGLRFSGLRGALCALAGMLCFPLLTLIVVAILYSHVSQHSGVAGALRGMSAVAAGMIIASGLKLLPTLKSHPLGVFVAGSASTLCFVAVAVFRLPLAYVLIVLGGGMMACVYRHLRLQLQANRQSESP